MHLKHAGRDVPGLNQYWFLAQGLRHFWPELIPRCGNIIIYNKWVCSPHSCGLLLKRNARILSCLGITRRRNSSHESIVDTTSPRENLSSGPPTSETLSSASTNRDKPIFAGDKFDDQFFQSTNNRGEDQTALMRRLIFAFAVSMQESQSLSRWGLNPNTLRTASAPQRVSYFQCTRIRSWRESSSYVIHLLIGLEPWVSEDNTNVWVWMYFSQKTHLDYTIDTTSHIRFPL